MKTKLKKWHLILMSLLALFIAVFASLFSLRADTVDEETGEILTDNWDLGLVFYDSTVDNGKTPLTEINWDASDESYKQGNPRIITVQLNYNNTNTVTSYAPGEFQLNLERLFKTTNLNFYQKYYLNDEQTQYLSFLYVDVNVGANDSNHSGFDWNLINTNETNWIFSNAVPIEENSNFQGSIQVQYTITPASCTNTDYSSETFTSYSETINAFIGDLKSNEITFNYQRLYKYNWIKNTFTIEKTALPIISLDGFPEGEYYWIKYNFKITGDASDSYPYIKLTSNQVRDSFPEDCLVYDKNIIEMTPSEGNTYYIQAFTNWTINDRYTTTYIYVGYPKSIYNELANNLIITNHADLYVQYADSNDFIYQDESEVIVNLANFEFTYSGNLYGISKNYSGGYGGTYYESLIGQDTLIGNKGISSPSIVPTAIYSGKSMDVKFGDDLLYITNIDSSYRKLQDSEYYFSSISFPNTLKNGNNQTIEKGKYNCELWIRSANSTTYTLHEEFTNQLKSWSFTKENAVVGYYFIIKEMTESLKNNKFNSSIIINNATNIAETGNIYNFAFIQVYIDNILQNEPELSNYANFITQEEIATFDQNTYGTYMQRSFDYLNYYKFKLSMETNYLDVSKTMKWVQNTQKECFEITSSLALTGSWDSSFYTQHELETYGDSITDEYFIKGWEIYDLLPAGFTLTSTEEEIINSFYTCINVDLYWGDQYSIKAYDRNLNKISPNDFKTLIKENTSVHVTYNYKNTGRTYIFIKIDLTDSPIIIDHCAGYGGSQNYVRFDIKSEISYDAFLEFGNVYKNCIYARFLNDDFYDYNFRPNKYSEVIKDNGQFDPLTADINQDGNTSDEIMGDYNTITISSIISTHQDLTKYVKTDLSDFTTGIVDASYASEYEYKLRVRSGQNNITNLIIYDSLETAQPEKTRWQGKFLGIDTTAAENKVYKLLKPNDPNADANGYISYNVDVKTYTSQNPDAGNLYNTDGSLNTDWEEYIPETTYVQGLEIKFSDNSTTESSYDFVQVYYKYNGKTYFLPDISGSRLAGATLQIPSNDFYLRWHTDSAYCSYYGFNIDSITYKNIPFTGEHETTSTTFSEVTELTGNEYPDSNWDGNHPYNNYGNNIDKIWHYTYTGEKEVIIQGTDKSKVKALAFEYLNEDGTPAIIPANNLTYVLIQMKSPADENETRLARNNCRTQWNALDDYDQPVDFITGINSNVVKIALPNSVDENSAPNISLKFTKEIQGTDSQFDDMQLDKAAQQIFMIRLTSLTANDDGNYNQVTALLKSDQELIISQIPVGTYLLEEFDDNYFNFVNFAENNEEDIIIEDVTFERTNAGYVITVSEDLTEDIEFNIKVTNEIEQFRSYEDKDNKENLFLKNKINDNIIDPDNPQDH